MNDHDNPKNLRESMTAASSSAPHDEDVDTNPTTTSVVFIGIHKVVNNSVIKSNNNNSNNGHIAQECDPLDSNNSIGAVPHMSLHRHEPSMNDIAFLMREQDAALLESIHFTAANDDSGEVLNSTATATTGCATSPVEHKHHRRQGSSSVDNELTALSTYKFSASDAAAATTSTAPSSVSGQEATPGLPLYHSQQQTASSLSTTSRLLRASSRGASTRALLLLRNESSGVVQGGEVPLDECNASAAGTIMEGGISISGERSRRALSGEIWVVTSSATSVPAAADTGIIPTTEGSVVSSSPCKLESLTSSAAVTTTEAEVVECSDQSSESPENVRGIVRSCSLDRRLNEAAQFAEAVGELGPSEQDELRIIEEDQDAEEYDTDDDDATEIHVEQRSRCKPTRKEELLAGSLPGEVSITNKVRPQWPFNSMRTKGGFLDKLPETNGATSQDFVYKGIRANPPEIVQRGVTRGNYSCLHRKAWLECTDKYHRYGKNLRLYYRYWERLGFPTNQFFDWLDSKGEAAGQPLPELEERPRSQLDSDTVLYITDEQETRGYAVGFIVDETGKARVVDVDNELVKTGPDGWIFVLRDNEMYGAKKITSVKGLCKQRFHHSSFFGGKAVAAAGIFTTDDNGALLHVLPHSGHYRPGEAHMQRMLFFLHNQGVDLWSFQVDMQQMLHVARETDGTEKIEKKKKVECLRLVPAGLVACYLAHKARFIGVGIFAQIHRIKKADVATVTEALELIDDGSINVGRAPVHNQDTSQ